MKNVRVWSWSRLEPPFFAWSRSWSRPIWLEPESAPGPRTSGAGAAQKSGGSATLLFTEVLVRDYLFKRKACKYWCETVSWRGWPAWSVSYQYWAPLVCFDFRDILAKNKTIIITVEPADLLLPHHCNKWGGGRILERRKPVHLHPGRLTTPCTGFLLQQLRRLNAVNGSSK